MNAFAKLVNDCKQLGVSTEVTINDMFKWCGMTPEDFGKLNLNGILNVHIQILERRRKLANIATNEDILNSHFVGDKIDSYDAVIKK